jgi:outer membrane protein OmpA-like peptidoglycan-associated protein
MALLLLSLSACHSGADSPCACREQQTATIISDAGTQKLGSGILLIRNGDTLRFVIPSQYLFEPHSANPNAQAVATLQRVVAVLDNFRLDSVAISAYTAKSCFATRDQSLTEARSEYLVHELWHKVGDVRMVLGQGEGSCKPIACQQTAYNDRVELSTHIIHTQDQNF